MLIDIPKHPAMLDAVGKALQEMAKDKAYFTGKGSLPVRRSSLPITGRPILAEPNVPPLTDEPDVELKDETIKTVSMDGQEFPVNPDANTNRVMGNANFDEGPVHTSPKDVAEQCGETADITKVVQNMPPQPPASVISIDGNNLPADIPLDPIKDNSGRPWDARIDSGGRSILAGGGWRPKRGIDDATYATVVAELKGELPAEANPMGTPVAKMPAFEDIPEGGAQAAPGATQTLQPPPALSMSFAEFMTWYTGPEANGKYTPEQLTQACNDSGIPDLAQLGIPTNAHLVLAVKLTLERMGTTA